MATTAPAGPWIEALSSTPPDGVLCAADLPHQLVLCHPGRWWIDPVRPDDRGVHCAGGGPWPRWRRWPLETNDSLACGMEVVVACAGDSYCDSLGRCHDQHRFGSEDRQYRACRITSALPQRNCAAAAPPRRSVGGPGWMGYAQRRYQERFIGSVLKATLVVGIIRIIWHTPLLAYGTIPWSSYIFGTFALQIICTWLYNGAGASVLMAMIAHLFSNVMTATMRPLFGPADDQRYWVIMNAIEFLVALGVVIATRGRLGLKPTNDRAVANSE